MQEDVIIFIVGLLLRVHTLHILARVCTYT